jgi:transcriptional regulator with XRE-family HTH domain
MTKDRELVVQRLRERIKPENRIFVRKNLDISAQVYALLEQKGWSQKDFAQKLGKNESEVSKWLTGLHNITLQSIAKMEAVLEADIIVTPLEACEKYKTIEYITLTVSANSNEMPTTGFEGVFLAQSATQSVAHANLNPEGTNEIFNDTEVETSTASKLVA